MKITAVLLSIVMLSGCATMRRHPKLIGLVVGCTAGVTIAIVTQRGHCPNTYDGRPYSGTPPCPIEEAAKVTK